MKLTLRICCLFLVLIGCMQTGLANGEMKMYLDFARFRYDDTDTYLEIYYSLYDQRNEVVETSDVLLDFSLVNEKDKTVLASERITVQMEKPDASGQTVRGSLIKTVLPPGDYMITMLRLNEAGTASVDSIKYDFKTTAFKDEKIKVSDIELCSNIRSNSVNKEGLFYKNTMEVYPNPTRIFGMSNPQLFYYLEVYNITKHASDPEGMIEVHAAIKDKKGNTLEQKRYQRSRDSESLVEVGRFNIAKLDNGLYTLMVAVVDPVSEYSAFNISNFYVVNKAQSGFGDDPMAIFPQSEYYNMSEDVVDQRFEQAKYIATKTELLVYESLASVENKRMFVYKFWFDRERETPGLQEEYYNRVSHADEQFRFSNRDGWKSDRGRVYILYGAPDHNLRRPNNINSEPYEIWTYHNLDGGAKFLFVDDTGFKDYRLRSSTLRGEFYDPSMEIYFTEDGVQ